MTDRETRRGVSSCEVPLERGVALWRHTSIRAGGSARFYARPTDVDSVRCLLRWARCHDLAHAILGGGSNVLFPDAGYDGLIVHTSELRGRLAEGTRVRVAAGERLAETAWWATKRGLSGLEWACGIPGSIGGAVAMNAGTRHGDMAGVLDSVALLTEGGSVDRVPARSLGLAYRTSALLSDDPPGVLIGAVFALTRGSAEACRVRARSWIAERLERLPVGASVGSVFRNPPAGPTAGELLEDAGCKGLRIGHAVVSTRHANVIVNEGSDNAGDVMALIERMKRRVRDASGVELREEVVIYA